jgi:hypothetical protein
MTCDRTLSLAVSFCITLSGEGVGNACECSNGVVVNGGVYKFRAPGCPSDRILYSGLTVWDLLHVTLLAPRNLRFLLVVWNICAPLS